ncbi:MAG: SagB/ThcOx family dehydrogenase [Planctomycetes bacterium]|nr:SagB/ThcOx family dehydrogenase [Planctomycetota bacterium]
MKLAPFESSIAERYHEETKYSTDSLRREAAAAIPMDWTRQPVPFKRYEGQRVLLPTAGLPLVRRGLLGAEDDASGPGVMDFGRLGRILWNTNGCTRIVQMVGTVQHFRAAPSAGAMYPTEIYVATHGVPGIADGVHDYQVLDHSLARVRDTDATTALATACFHHPAFQTAQAVVLLTAEWQRSAWRYRERSYRRALLDTGHVLGNLVEAAPTEGFVAFPVGCFRDELVERVLDIDPADEGPLAVVPLVAADEAASIPELPLRAGGTTEWHRAVAAVGDRVPKDEPRRLAAALHLASRLDGDAPSVQDAERVKLPVAEGAVAIDAGSAPTLWTSVQPVTTTIAERRSTRSFRPAELPRGALFRALAHAYPDDVRALFVPGILKTFVVAMNVVGMPPGTYAYDPVARTVNELSRGRHAAAMAHLGLGQEIFIHAGAAVIHTVDLTRAVERLGDHVYRLLGLDAGQIGERLNLALLREGLGVSGCGGYYDDEMNRVLGIPEIQAVLYITAVGHPAE